MTNEGYSHKKNTLGYMEVYPKPTVQMLESHYRDKYYQNSLGSYEFSYSKDELSFFQNQAKLCEETISRYTARGKTLLDIGCGEGFFSQYFLNKGWTIKCVDFSSNGLERNNPDVLPFFEQANVLTYLDREDVISFQPCLINLDNVLEHVLEPVELLKKIKRIMSKNAIARIEVPNDFSAFQKLLVKTGCTKETWVDPLEHLSYFNKDSLVNLFEYVGFQILSLQADYPIEQFLLNEHSNYWKNGALGKAAHISRVVCTNYLAEKNISRFVDYGEAAADLEFGRVLTAYVRLAS